jgi:DNA-binding MltR family transcriptional regulator
MEDAAAADLSAFLKEFRNETDRGLALVSAAVIDEKLAEILAAFFQEDTQIRRQILFGREAALSTFSARTNAAFALGLIERSEYSEIAVIRKIRNEFAHSRHGTKFDSQNVANLCLKLKSIPPGKANASPRMLFTFAAVQTYMRLYTRPEHVAQERRQAKVWVAPGDVAWSPEPAENVLTIMFDKEGGPESVTIDFGNP